MNAPSRSIALFGTEEDVTPPHVLRAGKLSAELEAGNLRYVRWEGEEVLRAVSFIVRDKDWGTYIPEISDLDVTEEDDSFRVSLRAVAEDAEQRFSYEATISGHDDGRLTFSARGQTEDGFLTNRTGFVILHPIEGIAGAPVRIEHTGGAVEDGTFPEIIDPLQPMMDLRALSHTTPGGLKVRTLMEGDTFEMEDQRNWTDASYKTYVRPLALPWPYRIAPGEVIDQAITVTVCGSTTAGGKPGQMHLAPGMAAGHVPPLGLGLQPDDTASAAVAAEQIRALGPKYLVLHHDPREGHGRKTLAAMRDVAHDVGAEPWLEAVIESTDDAGAAREVAALGALAAELGNPFATVLVSPAPDLKCTLPGSEWPPAPDAARLYDAARAAFPGARIGGGMFSYFTELNRKRPPIERLDLVTFTTSPIVHAGDDRSVMETHEAHGAITKSIAGIAGDVPWVVGPSAIGVRDNPYGEAAKDNPRNIRQAMNRNDPRQRGLLGAAWTLGYFADFATGGASAIALGATTGPFGAIHAPAHYPQPWYDENGGVLPLFHVLRGVARLEGAALHGLGLSPIAPVTGMAVKTTAGTEIWIANKTPEPCEVTFDGAGCAAILTADNFARAAGDPAFLDDAGPVSSPLRLPGHAIARILTGG